MSVKIILGNRISRFVLCARLTRRYCRWSFYPTTCSRDNCSQEKPRETKLLPQYLLGRIGFDNCSPPVRRVVRTNNYSIFFSPVPFWPSARSVRPVFVSPQRTFEQHFFSGLREAPQTRGVSCCYARDANNAIRRKRFCSYRPLSDSEWRRGYSVV